MNMNTMTVTFLSVSTNSCTETFAVSTGVAGASVKDTVFIILCWVNMSVTGLEDVAIDNRTLLDGPDLAMWI